MKRIVAITLLLVMAAVGLTACVLSKYVTPADRVDPKAVTFAAEAGVTDANSYRGYANLAKVLRLNEALKAADKVYRLRFEQWIDQYDLDYGLFTEAQSRKTKIGLERERALFGERGLISLALPLVGLTGASGILGLMRKRPGDVTPSEMNAALADVGIDLDKKDRQMLELVRGVSVFMKKYSKKTEAGGYLRQSLRERMSADTKVEVEAIKAS
jgi:hypothetical protein